ncbi:tyrosine-type recombinase/integrase [Devosia ginsengisoli]|uniref:Core-binding (CB) domain-containing protein n=1 Tax=Devosia ginsengisoli TaxID=400770 RepID=A0A5B8LZ78_9HYPH|nr:DUF6538 domain-containing protein [Devosia ginsengisoli]QDZ13129.1 hypothetical protein FPZ08_21765 [Devosia ginsengisoli]
MSRFTARKRWLMAGPWAHPKTGILYYRKATPPDLWAARDRLKEFGIKVTREVHRSLGTKDQRPAEQLYLKFASEQETKWQRWRDVLRQGPQPLDNKQINGLAADHARAFLAQHEDDPFEVSPPLPIPSLDDLDEAPLQKMVSGMSTEQLESLKANLKAHLKATPAQRRVLGVQLLRQHPEYASIIGVDFATALEAIHGADTDAAMKTRSVHTDPATRRLVNFAMANHMVNARRGIEARQGGDYGPIEALDRAPSFAATSSPAPAQGDYLSLTELLNHKARTTSIRPKTVSTTRSYLGKFIAFLGHDDAARVTKSDVRRWRDSLMEQTAPTLLPKTIDDSYISAVKSVLAHGVKEFDLPSNAASNIRDTRPSPAPMRSKGWSEAEAVQILKATFDGSSKALSTPHKRALFWVPWILAYTGLRASEVTQFRGRHLSKEGGVPHLIITPLDGNTKSGKAWAVGIHQHLIEMGFLDLITQVGDGPLFYEPYEDDTDLTKLDGRHRAKDAAERVSEWVREEVGLVAPPRAAQSCLASSVHHEKPRLPNGQGSP